MASFDSGGQLVSWGIDVVSLASVGSHRQAGLPLAELMRHSSRNYFCRRALASRCHVREAEETDWVSLAALKAVVWQGPSISPTWLQCVRGEFRGRVRGELRGSVREGNSEGVVEEGK